MYIKISVEQDIQNGGRLIEALQKLMPIVAVWLNSEEATQWRLVIISPLVSAGEARRAYHLVGQALAETQVPIPLENIYVLSPVDLHYKQVRLASQGVPSGVILAQNFAGSGVAGDAYVYIMN